jgi:hypothetical protein
VTFLVSAAAVAAATAVANGQTDQQLIAQVRASAAEAVAPGSPPLVDAVTAPAAAAKLDGLTAKVNAATTQVMLLNAKLDKQAEYSRRMDAVEKQHAENKQLMARLVAATQPTPAPAQSASACTKCGPNCRCAPGQCGCQWPGQCLGVPDTRVERSVVVSRPAERVISRTYSEPVYYEQPRTYYVQPRRTFYYYPQRTYYVPTYYYSQPRMQCYGGQCYW